MKISGFHGRAQINVDAFYYDYTNLQVSQLRGTVFVIENAASAKLYGADVDFALLPVAGVKIDGGVALLHSEYRKFASVDPAAPFLPPASLDGNQLALAPKLSGRIGAQYTFGVSTGKIVLRGDGIYTSRNYFTPFEKSGESQGPHTLINAGITYKPRSERYTIAIYGQNLLNKNIIAQSYVSSIFAGAPVVGVLTPPRTYGVSVGFKF